MQYFSKATAHSKKHLFNQTYVCSNLDNIYTLKELGLRVWLHVKYFFCLGCKLKGYLVDIPSNGNRFIEYQLKKKLLVVLDSDVFILNTTMALCKGGPCKNQPTIDIPF